MMQIGTRKQGFSYNSQQVAFGSFFKSSQRNPFSLGVSCSVFQICAPLEGSAFLAVLE